MTATVSSMTNQIVWDRVVQLYQDGLKIRQIMAETDMSKSEVYYILKRRGITPSRQASSETTISAADLQAQLLRAYERIGELEAEVARLSSDS